MTTQIVQAPQIELAFYIRLAGGVSTYTINDSRIKSSHKVMFSNFKNTSLITLPGDITVESISDGQCVIRYEQKTSLSRILVYFVRINYTDLT
jgi:hypothetical protein